MEDLGLNDILHTNFYIQPFSEYKYSFRLPLIAYVFEGEDDRYLYEHFPELRIAKRKVDCISHKDGSDTLQILPISRDKTRFFVVMVYIEHPFKRKKAWHEDDINFYQKVGERTEAAIALLHKKRFSEVAILLPKRFHYSVRTSSRNRTQEHGQMFLRTVVESVVCKNEYPRFFEGLDKKFLKNITFCYPVRPNKKIETFINKGIDEGRKLGRTISWARDLIIMPPNLKTTDRFLFDGAGINVEKLPKASEKEETDWVPVKDHNFSSQTNVALLRGEEALLQYGKNGFGLINAVGKGSSQPPSLLKVHYRPRTRRQKGIWRITLIGKSVVMDLGGIDLKLTEYYNNMHYDMAGGAICLGVVRLAELVSLPVEIVCLCPVVHNALGRNATQPESVITSYDGKRVRITNTDAEGRLILADALAYSEHRIQPNFTITVGTLGEMSHIAPDIMKVFVTSDNLEKRVKEAEKKSSEKIMLWPRLSYLNHLFDEHDDDPTSDIVNAIDSASDSAPIVFLSHFLDWDQDLEWIFIDPSSIFEEGAGDYRVGPGFGVRFLWYLVNSFA